MVWRRTSPLAKQLVQISGVVRASAEALRRRSGQVPQADEA
jgi:hypothetical protein